MSELEDCYKCGNSFYGKSMMGHLDNCSGKKIVTMNINGNMSIMSEHDAMFYKLAERVNRLEDKINKILEKLGE